MARRRGGVPRPIRSTEYTIVFGTRGAEQGWRDVVAVQRNAVVAAWDRLTTDPLTEDLSCHALRGNSVWFDTPAGSGRVVSSS